MNIGEKARKWPAKLTRVADNINLEQATIGFYLEVEQSFEQLQLINKQLLYHNADTNIQAYHQN